MFFTGIGSQFGLRIVRRHISQDTMQHDDPIAPTETIFADLMMPEAEPGLSSSARLSWSIRLTRGRSLFQIATGNRFGLRIGECRRCTSAYGIERINGEKCRRSLNSNADRCKKRDANVVCRPRRLPAMHDVCPNYPVRALFVFEMTRTSHVL